MIISRSSSFEDLNVVDWFAKGKMPRSSSTEDFKRIWETIKEKMPLDEVEISGSSVSPENPPPQNLERFPSSGSPKGITPLHLSELSHSGEVKKTLSDRSIIFDKSASNEIIKIKKALSNPNIQSLNKGHSPKKNSPKQNSLIREPSLLGNLTPRSRNRLLAKAICLMPDKIREDAKKFVENAVGRVSKKVSSDVVESEKKVEKENPDSLYNLLEEHIVNFKLIQKSLEEVADVGTDLKAIAWYEVLKKKWKDLVDTGESLLIEERDVSGPDSRKNSIRTFLLHLNELQKDERRKALLFEAFGSEANGSHIIATLQSIENERTNLAPIMKQLHVIDTSSCENPIHEIRPQTVLNVLTRDKPLDHSASPSYDEIMIRGKSSKKQTGKEKLENAIIIKPEKISLDEDKFTMESNRNWYMRLFKAFEQKGFYGKEEYSSGEVLKQIEELYSYGSVPCFRILQYLSQTAAASTILAMKKLWPKLYPDLSKLPDLSIPVKKMPPTTFQLWTLRNRETKTVGEVCIIDRNRFKGMQRVLFDVKIKISDWEKIKKNQQKISKEKKSKKDLNRFRKIEVELLIAQFWIETTFVQNNKNLDAPPLLRVKITNLTQIKDFTKENLKKEWIPEIISCQQTFLDNLKKPVKGEIKLDNGAILRASVKKEITLCEGDSPTDRSPFFESLSSEGVLWDT